MRDGDREIMRELERDARETEEGMREADFAEAREMIVELRQRAGDLRMGDLEWPETIDAMTRTADLLERLIG